LPRALVVAWPRALVVAPPLALVALGVLAPATALVTRAATTEAWSRVLGDAETWRLVAVTAAQAAASTLLALAIGTPVAALLAHRRFPGRRAVRAAVTLPFVLPTVVVGAAFAGLVPAAWRASWTPVVLAHAWYNAGLVARIVAVRWEAIHPWIDDAARTLGAGPAARAASIALPLLRPALASAASITFVLCFASYGVVRVLGGPALATLETEVAFRAFVLGDVPGAIVVAALQLALLAALVAFVAPAVAGRRGARTGPPRAVVSRARAARDARERLAVAIGTAGAVALVAVPLAALATASLRVGSTPSLAGWRALADPQVRDAVGVSLRNAALAAALATAAGLSAASAVARARRPWLDVVASLPALVSAVTIGLGLAVGAATLPRPMRGAWWLVPLAHATVALPLAVRVLVPAARGVPAGVRDAARTLGASGARLWWTVDRPLLARATAAAAALAACTSLGEFGASSLLVRRGSEPLPLLVERLLGRAGDALRAQGFALAVLLAATCLVAILTIDGADARGGRP
jgi:thiamine transport system permease protein